MSKITDKIEETIADLLKRVINKEYETAEELRSITDSICNLTTAILQLREAKDKEE